jgi:tRNA(adenine34) deaminase
MDDRAYLRMVVQDAEKAFQFGGSPVAAVLVKDNQMISRSYSRRDVVKGQAQQDRIHHAEFNLITSSSREAEGATLYTTLEPCLMCMGLVMVARVSRVVWAMDDHWGGAMGLYNLEAEYIKGHLPQISAAPFPDLQTQVAQMWVEYLTKTNYEEFIPKVLGEQCKLLS